MTDLDAAGYLRELLEYNIANKMITPANTHGHDTFFTCALEHGIRALEERGKAAQPTAYRKNANGSFTLI